MVGGCALIYRLFLPLLKITCRVCVCRQCNKRPFIFIPLSSTRSRIYILLLSEHDDEGDLCLTRGSIIYRYRGGRGLLGRTSGADAIHHFLPLLAMALVLDMFQLRWARNRFVMLIESSYIIVKCRLSLNYLENNWFNFYLIYFLNLFVNLICFILGELQR
jgi:hypothetical protein